MLVMTWGGGGGWDVGDDCVGRGWDGGDDWGGVGMLVMTVEGELGC